MTILPKTLEEAREQIEKMGLSYEVRHPYSTFSYVIVGRLVDHGGSEKVFQQLGVGDDILQAFHDAVKQGAL
jgi:hypothetical protein